jgi:hypothetical protein
MRHTLVFGKTMEDMRDFRQVSLVAGLAEYEKAPKTIGALRGCVT